MYDMLRCLNCERERVSLKVYPVNVITSNKFNILLLPHEYFETKLKKVLYEKLYIYTYKKIIIV